MAQVNKISSFKSFTEVKNQEATMKLREENNAKRQETVGKIGAILDEMGLTSLSELDEDKKQALIKKMFGNVSEDEAEDIEDELIKLGKPKKLEERNAFLGARAKAIEEDKNEFEFNGKTYKVTVNEGNAFGDAVRKAKEAGEKEFEFDGETYKVEEAKRTKFTGKNAHDLYTQLNGKSAMVFVKNDWYSVDPSELKDDKGNYFTGYSNDGSDYDFELKDIDFIQESIVSEGAFYRIPKDVIGNELYLASQNLTNLYNRTLAGNDIDLGVIDTIIKALNTVKKSAKKFSNAEEVVGTVYEAAVNEANIALIKYVEDASNKTFKNGGNGQNLLDSAYELASHIETYAKGRDNNGPGEDGFYGPTVTSLFKRLVDAMSADDIKYNNQSAYESVVNEAASTAGELASFISQNAKHFASFLKPKTLSAIANGNIVEIKPGSKSFTITVDFDKKTIDTTGKPAWPESTSYIEIMEYVKTTKFKLNESVVTESYRIGEDDWQSILSDLKRIGWTIEGWTAIKQIGKSTDRKHIELEYDDNDSVLWTVYVGDTVVKDNGQFNARGLDAKELDKELFKIKGIKESEVTESGFHRSGPSAEATRKAEQLKKLKKLKDREESIARLKKLQLKKHKAANEAEVNEAEVSSDKEFKEYAMTVLKKAFGDEFDEAKAEEVVDGILKKCDGDYGAAVGMLTSSLGESFVTEAFDANYWEDYQEGAKKMKNPTSMQLQQEVEASVEDWNDNNEEGPSNEVTLDGEKKVLKLAKEFVKAKGYISTDIIDAMIAQES